MPYGVKLPEITPQQIDKHIQKVRPDATKGLYRAGVEAGVKLVMDLLKDTSLKEQADGRMLRNGDKKPDIIYIHDLSAGATD